MNVVRKECCVKVRVKVREIGSEKGRKVISGTVLHERSRLQNMRSYLRDGFAKRQFFLERMDITISTCS